MSLLQKQAVQMIRDISNDNIVYPSQKPDEKIFAFNELIASLKEAKNYLLDNFDPNTELEAARREKYGNIMDSENYQ